MALEAQRCKVGTYHAGSSLEKYFGNEKETDVTLHLVWTNAYASILVIDSLGEKVNDAGF